jgi:hypothetical protein
VLEVLNVENNALKTIGMYTLARVAGKHKTLSSLHCANIDMEKCNTQSLLEMLNESKTLKTLCMGPCLYMSSDLNSSN